MMPKSPWNNIHEAYFGRHIRTFSDAKNSVVNHIFIPFTHVLEYFYVKLFLLTYG